jgi:hypothetical protein
MLYSQTWNLRRVCDLLHLTDSFWMPPARPIHISQTIGSSSNDRFITIHCTFVQHHTVQYSISRRLASNLFTSPNTHITGTTNNLWLWRQRRIEGDPETWQSSPAREAPVPQDPPSHRLHKKLQSRQPVGCTDCGASSPQGAQGEHLQTIVYHCHNSQASKHHRKKEQASRPTKSRKFRRNRRPMSEGIAIQPFFKLTTCPITSTKLAVTRQPRKKSR